MMLKEKNTSQGLKLLLNIKNVDEVKSVKELLEILVLPTIISNS